MVTVTDRFLIRCGEHTVHVRPASRRGVFFCVCSCGWKSRRLSHPEASGEAHARTEYARDERKATT